MWLAFAALYWIYCCCSCALAASAAQNISIPNTSPQVIYTPFLCNSSISLSDTNSTQCNGGWRTINIDGSTVITTDGPDPQTGDIIPQMFLMFRASAMYLSTSSLSNATVNITLSAAETVVDVMFNSSVGLVAAVNLIEDAVTTLAITYVSGTGPSRLDIDSIMITVTNATVTSSFLPSQILPTSNFLPTYTPPTTSTSSQSTSTSSSAASPSSSFRSRSNNRKIAEGLGLVLGLGLGLASVAGAGFFYWRRRPRRRLAVSPNVSASHLGARRQYYTSRRGY